MATATSNLVEFRTEEGIEVNYTIDVEKEDGGMERLFGRMMATEGTIKHFQKILESHPDIIGYRFDYGDKSAAVTPDGTKWKELRDIKP